MTLSCPVGLDRRIHRLHLCRVRPPNKCLAYDTKQSDCEFPIMLELWGMRSTPSLPLLPGPHWPRVVAPHMVLSMGQIELNCVLILNWITWNRLFWYLIYILMLNWIVWTRTVFDIENVLMLNWIVWNRTVSTFNWV